MASHPFDFDGPQGYRLSGRLSQPERPRGWALFAHCFTCGKDSLAAARVTRALAAQGTGVLRFDFAGLGASGGSFADSSFAADVNDLIAAAQAMSAAGKPPSLLIGHSLGGAAALMAAGAMTSVRAVVTSAAPFDLTQVLHLFDAAGLKKVEDEGEAEVQLGGRPFVVCRTLVEGLRRHDLRERIAGLRRPLLVMHAPDDDTVRIASAAHIFAAARHPKSFVALDGADHLLTRRADADYVAGMISAWASRYLLADRDE